MSSPHRMVLLGSRVLLALSAVQLVVSLILVDDYAAWFRTEHPGTPTTAVLIALALRSLLAVGWLGSYRSLRTWLDHPGRRTGLAVLATAVVLLVGYGWLAYEGGPWWLEAFRLGQLAIAIGVTALLLPATTRRRLSRT